MATSSDEETVQEPLDEYYDKVLKFDLFRSALLEGRNDLGDNPEGSLSRLYRVFTNLYPSAHDVSGPILDVASGNGFLYGPFKRILPNLLPYAVTELFPKKLEVLGDEIDCHKFECERERIPLPDNSVGLVLFLDVLEHLIVDPMWPLLEFNRVLKPGGHVIIATPNVAAVERIFQVLVGTNPGFEIFIKPSAIYQRHNREWTPYEVMLALQHAGFNDCRYSTHDHLISDEHKGFLADMRTKGFCDKEDSYFGPEIYVRATKSEHVTLDSDLDEDIRWPEWLYTGYPNMRRRPSVFPIQVTDNYK